MSQHPAHRVTAVNVHDYIKVVVSPFFWAFELGDVPRPDLIGGAGKQFGFPIVRAAKLVAAFFRCFVFVEKSVVRNRHNSKKFPDRLLAKPHKFGAVIDP